ncbi:Putative cytidine and deoxycytidylate deaminase domain, cytidine deaminase [Septoria linicola]|uniref:Cytidine and deoxycytidylate deaminase domain, cytidine deaminase n=1 Tax=Septoria linicola TaxID=215465 RepID=A0A9Q9AQJ6_9PEZI|nr:putative cytidine and deoxycytidylate deaminase domain, cytidine deaminase [Septoria linicola]USW50241.1 Putative cytidine and deoxycytidylate deaminase domain, cytidine deaminase [Septoria linicola]
MPDGATITRIKPDDHAAFMSLAIEQALLDTSHSAPGKYRVGAVLINQDTGEIVSTGYALELPGNMAEDVGSTHAEQCCFMKVAQQHGLPIARAETHIEDALPKRTVIYTTMAPCHKRSVPGARTCCERMVELKARLKTVYVGMAHLQENAADKDAGRKQLEAEGIKVIDLEHMRDACYVAATGESVHKA